MRWVCLLLLIVPVLSGCYEGSDVTLHEAHKYKGKDDRHVGDPGYRREQLKLRFETVQSDR
ncbi:hypothetical protein [Methylocaldum sp.]|uniref:hypothetical protein n=1 Tax=Methylocaldum sp. TaxID=1969727 RepID=UPI002D2A4A62|nr:hypothetical protein [Methylocaldum sp.]HYE36016.1 hypothetical protein [Methylocaldum sp.]